MSRNQKKAKAIVSDRHRQLTAKKRIGIALRRLLAGTAPSKDYLEIFGCGPIWLRGFIEHQLQGCMTMENMGEVWKVGHILPLFEFDQDDDEQVKLCWNWVNLCPVWVAARMPRSPGESLIALQYRQKHFPKCRAIDALVAKALALTESTTVEPDWTKFEGKGGYMNGD